MAAFPCWHQVFNISEMGADAASQQLCPKPGKGAISCTGYNVENIIDGPHLPGRGSNVSGQGNLCLLGAASGCHGSTRLWPCALYSGFYSHFHVEDTVTDTSMLAVITRGVCFRIACSPTALICWSRQASGGKQTCSRPLESCWLPNGFPNCLQVHCPLDEGLAFCKEDLCLKAVCFRGERHL